MPPKSPSVHTKSSHSSLLLNISQVAVTFGDPYSNQGWGSGGIVGSVMGLGGSASDLTAGLGGRGKSGGDSVKPAVATGGGVNGFDPNNGLIICSTGDFVCGVVPNIGGTVPKATAPDTAPSKAGAGHLSYIADGSIQKALAFIAARVDSKGEEAAPAPKPKSTKPKSPPPATEGAAEAKPKSSKPKSPPAEEAAAEPGAAKPKGLPKGKTPPFAGDLLPMPENFEQKSE